MNRQTDTTVEQLLNQLGHLETSLHSQNPSTGPTHQEAELSTDAHGLKKSAELLLLAGDVKLARNILRAMVQNGQLVGWALRSLGQSFENDIHNPSAIPSAQIGRASCRERV